MAVAAAEAAGSGNRRATLALPNGRSQTRKATGRAFHALASGQGAAASGQDTGQAQKLRRATPRAAAAAGKSPRALAVAGGGVSDGGEDGVGRRAQQQQQRIVHESLPFSKAYVPSERSQLAAKQASYNRATTKVPPCILRADKLTFTVAGGRERQMMDLQSAMSKRQQEHENKALLAVFARMSATGTRLDENDIARALISLGHPFTAQEVQKMLWEVDDDACGYLTPEAFQAMYYRVRASTERDEPRGLFRLIEFMMIDADGSGSIDIDEAMTIFRTRFGKGAVDSVISVFAERATREGIAIEFAKISYSDFVKSSNLIVLY